ncbi:MAG TPA: fluoride efflux transporter CrcB [Nitrospiria bacterium]
MLLKLIGLAVIGALGTLARYGLGGLIHRAAGEGFPWGTLVVNVAGCFLFGLFWAAAEHRFSFSPEIRTVVLVGFMGSFTTFSTFAFETVQLLRDAQWGTAAINIAAQNLTGLAALFLGLAAGRAV